MAKTRQQSVSPAAGDTSAAQHCAGDSSTAPIVWRGRARVIATILILYHLTAVVMAPLSVQPSGDSRLWQVAATPFWPYIEAADLNHGYRFFGPDPGPSHLVRYELQMPNDAIQKGVFPNLEQEQPRLLYHRYFMLSEHLNDLYRNQLAPKDDDGPRMPEQFRRRAEAAFQTVVRSYAEELLHRTGAKSVHMLLIEHGFPSPQEFLAGRQLNDPSLYRVEADLGTFPEKPR